MLPNKCIFCEQGTYQSGFGSSYCDLCPHGKYNFSYGMDDASYCAFCSFNYTLMETYIAEKLVYTYFTGGLGKLASSEFTSWWCLALPCVEPGDLACFKYNHLKKKFYLWGTNYDLGLVRIA